MTKSSLRRAAEQPDYGGRHQFVADCEVRLLEHIPGNHADTDANEHTDAYQHADGATTLRLPPAPPPRRPTPDADEYAPADRHADGDSDATTAQRHTPAHRHADRARPDYTPTDTPTAPIHRRDTNRDEHADDTPVPADGHADPFGHADQTPRADRHADSNCDQHAGAADKHPDPSTPTSHLRHARATHITPTATQTPFPFGAIRVTKTDKAGAPLQGATFTIKGNGMTVYRTTGPDGTFCVSGFSFGQYTVQETAAPPGYTADNPSAVTVAVDRPANCAGTGTPNSPTDSRIPYTPTPTPLPTDTPTVTPTPTIRHAPYRLTRRP